MANQRRKEQKSNKKRALRKDYQKRKNIWNRNTPTVLTNRYSPSAGDGILPASRKALQSKKYRRAEAELHKLANPQ